MKTKKSSGAVIKFFLVLAIVFFAVSISKAQDYCPAKQLCHTYCGSAIGWTSADGYYSRYDGGFIPDPPNGNWYSIDMGAGKQDVEVVMQLTSNADYDLRLYGGRAVDSSLYRLCSSVGAKGGTRYCYGTVSDGAMLKITYGNFNPYSYYAQINCPYVYYQSASTQETAKIGDYLNINVTIGYNSWRQQDVFFVVDMVKGDGPNCEKLWCGNPSTDEECGIGSCTIGSPLPLQKIGGGTTVTSINVPLSENGTNGEYKVYITAYHSAPKLSFFPDQEIPVIDTSNPYFTRLYAGTVNVTGGIDPDIILGPISGENEKVGFFPLSTGSVKPDDSGHKTVLFGASAVALTTVVAGLYYALSKVPINSSPEKKISESIEKMEKLFASNEVKISDKSFFSKLFSGFTNNSSSTVVQSELSKNETSGNTEFTSSYKMEDSTKVSVLNEGYENILDIVEKDEKLNAFIKKLNSVPKLIGNALSLIADVLTFSETYDYAMENTGNKDYATGLGLETVGMYTATGPLGLFAEANKIEVCDQLTEGVRNYRMNNNGDASFVQKFVDPKYVKSASSLPEDLLYYGVYNLLDKYYDLSDSSLMSAEYDCLSAVDKFSPASIVKMLNRSPEIRNLSAGLGFVANTVASVALLPLDIATTAESYLLKTKPKIPSITTMAYESTACMLTNPLFVPSSNGNQTFTCTYPSSPMPNSSYTNSSAKTFNPVIAPSAVPSKNPKPTTNSTKLNLTSISSTATNVANNIVNAVTPAVNNVTQFVNNVVTTATNVVKSVGTTIANTVTSGFNAISNTIGNLFGGKK